MTERKINSNRICDVCTGCGQCIGVKPDFMVLNISGGQPYNYETLVGIDNQCMIAVDIGTTTVAMLLRRLSDGVVVDTYSRINPQRKHGADVLSRIKAAEQEEIRAELENSIREVIREGIQQFKKVENAPLTKMVIACNTTMVYLLMGYATESLGIAPFKAEHLEKIEFIFEGIPTTILPGISTFIGADIVAGIYSQKIHLSEEVHLLIDLGTNGEMVLGNKKRILTTATAAGPAFEGRLASGVWGSDLIAIAAYMLKKGIMDETGLLMEPYFEEGITVGKSRVTQMDIRSLQVAKAAIYAGIRILCERYGITYQQIEKVYLAGGFGYYLDPNAAIQIGLLPSELQDRVVSVGNAALEGAFLYGRNPNKAILNQTLGKTEEFNLAMQQEFNDIYVEAMYLKEM